MNYVQPILTALPTLAVAAMYCMWNATRLMHRRRQRVLRERVTYMLWVMAHTSDRAADEELARV